MDANGDIAEGRRILPPDVQAWLERVEAEGDDDWVDLREDEEAIAAQALTLRALNPKGPKP